MVSQRCKMFVKDELKKLGLHFVVVDLGEVDIMEELNDDQRDELNEALMVQGLELMDDKKAILIEKIKNIIVKMVHDVDDAILKVNFSEYISKKLGVDYFHLSRIFVEVQGMTIEQFIISHKVEKVKELIMYGELTISEIAWKMNYSSLGHLSNQFKKVTGLSPSNFKALKDKRRSPLEEVGNENNL